MVCQRNQRIQSLEVDSLVPFTHHDPTDPRGGGGLPIMVSTREGYLFQASGI